MNFPQSFFCRLQHLPYLSLMFLNVTSAGSVSVGNGISMLWSPEFSLQHQSQKTKKVSTRILTCITKTFEN